jgi:tetratricopeptide (TPR) repeat protein
MKLTRCSKQAVLLFVAALMCQFAEAKGPSAYDHSAMIEMQTLEARIHEQEMQDGRYSLTLYQPLRALGKFQLKYGSYEKAIDTFRRMRQYGVNTEKQLESIDLLVAGFAARKDYLAVDAQQHFQYRLANMAFAVNNPQRVSAELKLADWYRSTSRHDSALGLYQNARDSLIDIDPNAEIRILRSEALTTYLAGRCCAADYLSKALDVVVSNQTDVTLETTVALTDFNDMKLLEQPNLQTGLSQKNQNAKFLGFSDSKDLLRLMSLTKSRDLRSDMYVDFGEQQANGPGVSTVGYPLSMCGTTFDELVRSHHDQLEVDVTLTVNAHGRPAQIEISGEAPGRLKRFLKDSLKLARYRTATDETGKFVASELSFRQSFDQQSLNVTSSTPVNEWSQVLVAQTCQISGIQRI